jgi:hypothetical protein
MVLKMVKLALFMVVAVVQGLMVVLAFEEMAQEALFA